ncbi:hypothetical protein DEO72_LG6g2668 [Vigna unguiculata]|uniref:Uncharacterized protein n=1 Tax=Vigna unguiculata TaxID=3917 RepID=A0A4D6MDT0_VIGUN|nr:hypothetical protein DEO72_LG6g2668 [Vigna unguiculata]
MPPTTQNIEENSVRARPCTRLVQAMSPRSGERGLSLKLKTLSFRRDCKQKTRGGFASSYLSETFSLERDCSSLKVEIFRMSDNSSIEPIKFPRILVWARPSHLSKRIRRSKISSSPKRDFEWKPGRAYAILV